MCKRNRKVTTLKVVIPKGLVNPDETTIIEIPSTLQREPVVVAQRKPGDTNGVATAASPMAPTASQQPLQAPQYYIPPTNQTVGQLIPQAQCPSGCHMQPAGILDSNDLYKTEEQERMELQKDLEAFQNARRKLIASTNKLTSKNNILLPNQTFNP